MILRGVVLRTAVVMEGNRILRVGIGEGLIVWTGSRREGQRHNLVHEHIMRGSFILEIIRKWSTPSMLDPGCGKTR